MMIRIPTSVAALTLIVAANGALAADRLTDTQLDAVTAGLLPTIISCPGCSDRGTASNSSSSTSDGVTVTTDITKIIGGGGTGGGGTGGGGSGGGGTGGGGTGGGGTGALPTVPVPANLGAIEASRRIHLVVAPAFIVQLNH